MSVSLHIELQKLHKTGVLELKRDPRRHRPGEGAYHHKGHRITVVANHTGPLPGNPQVVVEEPHDVAWCRETNVLLAAAPSGEEVRGY